METALSLGRQCSRDLRHCGRHRPTVWIFYYSSGTSKPNVPRLRASMLSLGAETFAAALHFRSYTALARCLV
jgi:hypothetical protein